MRIKMQTFIKYLSKEEKADTRKCIKDHCVVCQKKQTKTLKDYLIRGNYCPACNGRIQDEVRSMSSANMLETPDLSELFSH